MQATVACFTSRRTVKTTNLHGLSSFGATMNEGGTVKQRRLTRRAAFLMLRGLK